ncbi:MAG: SDR family oxidoreductase [Anaerolineales bacterium]|nr:SDR family oxidoreductase [Anaerolineales bacterium]
MELSLKGRTILVTGATNGIGLVTARELARLGGQVTLVSRSAKKCARVAGQIQAETGSPVEYIAADLSTLGGSMETAAVFKKRHTRLHILVNNAGAYYTKRHLTPDGLEMTFALNHMSYFILTNLLLETLKSSAPARVVNVSSRAHMNATFDFENLQGEKGYNGWKAYGQSKLANLLFTYELARRLEGTGVTVNALHPGFVATGFARNNGPFYNLGTWLAGLFFARDPDQGAKTSICLAASPEIEGLSGLYFVDCQPAESSPASHDLEVAKRLWQVSLEIASQAA